VEKTKNGKRKSSIEKMWSLYQNCKAVEKISGESPVTGENQKGRQPCESKK